MRKWNKGYSNTRLENLCICFSPGAAWPQLILVSGMIYAFVPTRYRVCCMPLSHRLPALPASLCNWFPLEKRTKERKTNNTFIASAGRSWISFAIESTRSMWASDLLPWVHSVLNHRKITGRRARSMVYPSVMLRIFGNRFLVRSKRGRRRRNAPQ